MKKIYALLIIVLLAFSGCFDDGDSDKNATLKVTVNYTGTGTGTVDEDHKLFLAAFQMKRGNMDTEEVRTESIRPIFKITDGKYGSKYLAESTENNKILTLNIPAGTYYLIAMLNTQEKDLEKNKKGEFKNFLFREDSEYVIYDDVDRTDPTAFTPVVLTSGEVNSDITMTIDGSFKETGG